MVREQITGPGRNITNASVIAAMSKVPRHELVPASVRPLAYRDRAMPIGHAQTISQPFIVAFMTEQLDPKPEDRVLEIGTGSGYQAAVLAELVAEVYTIEIVEPLGPRAKEDLARLGYENVHVKIGDGYEGWPEHAPFDSIIVTCAPEHVPQPLVEQLKEGGRMIIPVGAGMDQRLYLLKKEDGKVEQEAVLPVVFVPMTGEKTGR
jgi:protein-L-isoaspartate(D-aspartate) O-methyltransferase